MYKWGQQVMKENILCCSRMCAPAQVKILREDAESGKLGPDGRPRSKGIAFIEFRWVAKVHVKYHALVPC
jgi:hypothetical protein